MAVYVLVHGAAHEGKHFEPTAEFLRAEGHTVHTPTLAGNRPSDVRAEVGLDDAIESLVSYLTENSITDAVLLGHSYGGMVITGAADRLPEGAVRRLIYFVAFVPNNGESLYDMIPDGLKGAFEAMSQEKGEVHFPFPILREAFINDGTLDEAKELAETLNPHPVRTMRDKITLSKNPAEMMIGKSYLLAAEDTAQPSTHAWHPNLSEKLGLYRLVSMPGSHSVHATNPKLLAQKIIEAGRD